MWSTVISTAVWKKFEHKKKVFELQTHCRDKAMDLVVKQYPIIMAQLKTKSDALLLDLTLIAAFKHIMKHIINLVTTQEEYAKTHTVLLGLDF